MAASTKPANASGVATRQALSDRLRDRLTTTPGRMRLAAAAIVVGLLLMVIVGTGAVRARQRAASAVGQQAEPLLVGAQVVYSSLADADATATNTFLKAGAEPQDRRQAYLDDLTTAGNQLAAVARQAGSSQEAAQALSVITKDLPTYSGLVEAARANNRLGLPVGAAYLREGSALMQGSILPAVRQLYQVEAARLDRAYSSGRSLLDIVGVLIVGGLALAILVASQLFLARRTNRLLNPALLGASLATFALMAWALVGFSMSASRLQQARTKGSDPVQVLSSTRILLSRAQADENLSLVARGSGSQYLADFDAVTAALGPADGSSGLIAQADRTTPTSGATPLSDQYATYLKAHHAVQDAAKGGDFTKAVTLATSTGPSDELSAASQLTSALGNRIDLAQMTFAAKAGAGRHDLAGLNLALIGILVVAAALTIVGLQQRINEYR